MKRVLMGFFVFASVSISANGISYSCDKEGLDRYTAKIVAATKSASYNLVDYPTERTYDKVLKRLKKNIKREKKKIEDCFE